MDTPVVLITFNRPELTKKTLERIKMVRPSRLFIISDGPRSTKKGEGLLIQQTRDVLKNITWPCDIERKYEEKNLGCKISVSSGLNWVFSKVDRAIILEDDCVPDRSFFYFCEELLEKYKNNHRIMHISGSNLLEALSSKHTTIDTSYYFSYLASAWGWATWSRAWKNYDVAMKSWPKEGQYILESHLSDSKSRLFMKKQFDDVFKGKIDTWDYQWIYTCWTNNALAISPYSNMITNMGFNSLATHTKFETKFSQILSHRMKFPLHHPKEVIENKDIDMLLLKSMYPESLIVDIILKKLPFLKMFLRPHS